MILIYTYNKYDKNENVVMSLALTPIIRRNKACLMKFDVVSKKEQQPSYFGVLS